jgi:pimeloyl-ACP methyl ester carboxylesterase
MPEAPHIRKADLAGGSDGGIIGTVTAIRHPARRAATPAFNGPAK